MAKKRIPSPIRSKLCSSSRAVLADLPSGEAASVKAQPAGPSYKLIASTPVRDLCGGISDMTLWRWLHRKDLDFPGYVVIARRRYWREADVLAWLEVQAATKSAA